MILPLLKKLLIGDRNEKALKRYRPRVEEINDLEEEVAPLSDEELFGKTDEFKARLKEGETLDDLLPEAFAVVRETAKRILGERHYDVQLIGGMVLHDGAIAEMKTGEGKTLAATLPVYLNALEGKGVHIVTVNDYLASRDAGWMGQVYKALGLETSVITGQRQSFLYDPEYEAEGDHDDERLEHLRPIDRREAYRADITYGTNNEFGFDYLRDNMVSDPEQITQRELHYTIVDEIDSILVDEARTPLIISGPAEDSADAYSRFASVVKKLKPDHYETDEKARSVTLTDEGVSKIQQLLNIDNLYDSEHISTIFHLEQALKAEYMFKRDKNYVVRDGDVVIVDEFTGRLMPGRRYSEGLHQAIEAKEGVNVLQESTTLATISFQNYFRLYNKLSGMTGTAKTEEEEFFQIYKLNVVVIPTNEPVIREDMADRIYKTEEAKFKAIGRDVKERNDRGQPVLIGTVSIEKNEQLSTVLDEFNVPHEVLNAKNNEREAAVVEKAGQKGSVTLATNIAGRGTDIVLGEGVEELGGLHVLGSERHESRRIDNQLRGRSGRQGSPGSSQFYVSLEDDIMRIFGGDRISNLMESMGVQEDVPIENRMVSKAIESAQKKVESHNFDIRKNVVKYDDVMNKHRQSIYGRRRDILYADNLKPEILELYSEELEELVESHRDKKTDTIDRKKVIKIFGGFVKQLEDEEKETIRESGTEEIKDTLFEQVKNRYEGREEEYGEEAIRYLERALYLRVVDTLWMQHLENMDHLRQGIGLRGVGGKDPLVEYKNEGYRMFNELVAQIRYEVVSNFLRTEIRVTTPEEAVETDLTRAAEKAQVTRGSSGPQARQKTAKDEVDTSGLNRAQRRRLKQDQKQNRKRKEPR